jgi:ubiquinone biosynthesis protein Coq4
METTRARHAFMAQDSVQMLADALEEYYQANAGKVVRPEQLPEASRTLFRNHDICHVIFGLDTTLEDEAMADVRALVSTTVGWRRYWAYLASDKAARAIFRKVGFGDALRATLRATPRAVRALFQALTTRRRWPWDAPDRFLIRSLKHLRREYHIKVI